MEVTKLFSKGFEVFKNNWIIAVPLIAVGVVIGVIRTTLMGSMMAGAGFMGMSTGAFSMGSMLGTVFLIGLIGKILSYIAMGMTYVMADDAVAGKADLNTGLQKTTDNIVNLVVGSVLVGVIVLIGTILLVLPGVIAAYLLMFSIVIIMLENKEPVAALQESFNLVKDNLEQTVFFAVLALVVMIVAWIIGGIFGFIPVLGSVIISPVVTGTATAYISIVLVLLYKEIKK